MAIPPPPPPTLPKPSAAAGSSNNGLPISTTIVLRPDLRHVELEIEKHLKEELGLKLDTDQQLCPQHLLHLSSINQPSSGENQQPPCQLGNQCPFRHATPSSLNFTTPPVGSAANRNHHHHHHSSHSKTVLQTLVTVVYAKRGNSFNGDECMYLHVDERMRVLECMDFRRGFCPKGPDCPQKTHQKTDLPIYMAGSVPTKRPATSGGTRSLRWTQLPGGTRTSTPSTHSIAHGETPIGRCSTTTTGNQTRNPGGNPQTPPQQQQQQQQQIRINTTILNNHTNSILNHPINPLLNPSSNPPTNPSPSSRKSFRMTSIGSRLIRGHGRRGTWMNHFVSNAAKEATYATPVLILWSLVIEAEWSEDPVVVF
ncbi:RNA-binding component of cleavage and polyadenylation factor [Puccinia graminis f. sp. tritici]|uniref:mRNA 3'-end-processing protein n=1 Tax=Puccinia graminis f. sp. tritici TaxID=56615 RepID=A0A5B0N6I4_PUCGR|nr:RNA-binding component of cleavage and polyadenylation factor [Puccinia graminis f. sp. tritici]